MRRCIIIFLLFPLVVSSQIYEDFELQQVNDKVFVSWTLKEGNTCNGMEVQRSVDSLNFLKIHEIAGICGSADKKEFYDFTDSDVHHNQKYYYRLKLGVQGVTEIKSIDFFSTLGKEVLVFPNPSKEGYTFVFNEEKYHTVEFYSISGQKVWVYQFDYVKSIFLDPNLRSGVYLVKFISDQNSILQKVVIDTK